MNLILIGIIGSFVGVGAGLLVIWQRNRAKKLMISLLSFASAAFLGVSFLDLLPEAIEAVEEPHFIFIAFLIGLTAFFILERALMKYLGKQPHTHDDHTESLPALIIVGDSLHNFLDGIAIVIAYVAHPVLGLTTALAVAAHEIPQEIGDFSVLLDRGWSNSKVILTNIYCGLATFVGMAVGYFSLSTVEGYLPYFLAAVAGIFTYIGLSDLIPEIHHRAGHKNLYRVIIPFIFGLILIGYISISLH